MVAPRASNSAFLSSYVANCYDMGFQEAPLEEALKPNPARAAPGTPPQVDLPALTPLGV
jgi:hypothetical protein